ncbi:DUF3616 domain-containing protein [Thiothrix winogradskyi]|uniref:DUF3616 domain-containing protein n=1 Tax=Thiothrix winogradskyi TaxID=96472 RepID=A0ABY3SZC5_9GAMM|nr:DUF3616 domain-containing protein [Thiothrix winogradskyi]UJS24883.1 DUF3616 domain-containing protein [Thiothrix winogradskyi]
MTAVHFKFAPAALECRDALSAIVQIGDTLWVANDESIHLERLSYQGSDADGNPLYAAHTRFALHDYLSLPVAADAEDNEVDVEGLAYQDGYLWVVGSHSLKRKKPQSDKSTEKGIERLVRIVPDPNRYLIARIPLNVVDGIPTLQTPGVQLPLHANGNALMEALRDDPHIKHFLKIPGKDNGFDVEGLAVIGKRLFLGLRGPVLRGWAVLLEIECVEDDNDPTVLTLARIGEEDRPYRKHFLQLDGLGIRDLCVQGEDLLILAGPTMSLDGPVRVYRWQGGAKPDAESLIPRAVLEVVAEIPHGHGNDHAEGLCLFTQGNDETALLVVYDNAAAGRKRGESGVLGDVFVLPSISSPPE